MKLIASALRKLNRGKWLQAVFVLCAVTVMALAALTPTWAQTFTTLHSFDPGGYWDSVNSDGSYPYAALVQATNGNLYGTTHGGGAGGGGTVFEITSNGTLTTLYNFCTVGPYCVDSAYPFAGLIQATDGNL